MGYLRFFLVFAVIFNHLGPGSKWEGHTAVFGFYMLSGFLITLVTQEVYGNSLLGRGRFLANRFLRIYPTYWTCALISWGILVLTNDSFHNALYNVGIPNSPETWIPNIIIYGISSFNSGLFGPRIVTTAWSLSIELVYYLIIGLIAGHSRIVMWLLLAASMANSYNILHTAPNSFDPLYLTVYGPAPMFFIGGLMYFYRNYLKRICTTWLWVPLVVANVTMYIGEISGAQIRDPQINEIPVLYKSVPFMAYAIICCYFYNHEKPPTRFEQFLADVSYPMFLLHPALGYGGFFCIRIVDHFLDFGCTSIIYQSSWWFFGCSVVSTFVGSSLVVLGVDQPMKYFRARIRTKAQEKKAASLATPA